MFVNTHYLFWSILCYLLKAAGVQAPMEKILKFVRSIAIWMMVAGAAVAFMGGVWAAYQLHLVNYPVIVINPPPKIIGEVSPGRTFYVQWFYIKREQCIGSRTLSLVNQTKDTFIRIDRADENWPIDRNSITEAYYTPTYVPEAPMTLLLEVNYFCNFIRTVHQRISTVTLRVGDDGHQP